MLRRPRDRVLAAAGAYLVFQVVIAVIGTADRGFLSDDAFYYFQIARNVVHGKGWSFDGIAPTNGFHPLLAWVDVLVYALFPESPWLPVRLALIFLAGCAAATSWVVYRIGRALGGEERTGELMAAAWLVSPYVWLLPLRGCEGALLTLCLALAVWNGIRLERPLLFGALIGLCGLARTENVLFAVPAFGYLAWRTRSARAVAVAGAAAAAVVAPWVIWNLVTFGTVVQVSGAVKQAFGLYGGLPPVDGPVALLANLYAPFEHTARFVVGEEWAARGLGRGLVIVQGALLLAALVAGGRGRRLLGPAPLLPLYILAALHLGYYALVQRNYFNWYFLPVALAGAVWQGERLAGAPRRVATGLCAAGAVVCAAVVPIFMVHYGHRPHEAERWASYYLKKLPSDLPPGTRVGMPNAGRVGYFGGFARPGVTWVNLDGVVNNRLFAAWREGRIARFYLDEVDWVIDGRGNLETLLGAAAGEAFARDHLVPYRGDWDVARVVGDPLDPAEQPARPAGARVMFDFEAGLDGWTLEGTAFAIAPGGRRAGQPLVAGFRGRGLLGSFASGNRATGRARSPPFSIDRPTLGLLVGGGGEIGRLRIALLVDGRPVRKATGGSGDLLVPVVWDVRDLLGKTGVLEIVDQATGSYGHLLVDDVIAY